MIFPERLKLLREKERYSLEGLSKIIGVKSNTIWRWENNKAKPDTDTVVRIAHALNTTVAYLLGETDDPTPNASLVFNDANEQIQKALALAKRIGNDEVDLKKTITAGMSEETITIKDENTNLTYCFPNNEEGRKSLALFLGYSMGMKLAPVSNAINGDNNSGNKLGVINT